MRIHIKSAFPWLQEPITAGVRRGEPGCCSGTATRIGSRSIFVFELVKGIELTQKIRRRLLAVGCAGGVLLLQEQLLHHHHVVVVGGGVGCLVGA